MIRRPCDKLDAIPLRTTTSMRSAAPAFAFVVLTAIASSTSSAPATDQATLRAELAERIPDMAVSTVNESPVEGVYTVQFEGGGILHVSRDGHYAIAGDMYSVSDGMINLTEKTRSKRRAQLISGVDIADMIVFSTSTEPKAVLHVFTDVDCGYCRQLHNERHALRDLGIEIRYLAYPREGVGSKTYSRMVSAWCSDDPQAAITTLKSGGTIPDRTCDDPVASQYALGQALGVSGTPSSVTDEGRFIQGYSPSNDLAERLGVL